LVVVDAGPIIALAGAEQLGVLRELFVRVVMPTVVRDEIAAPPEGRPGAAAILSAEWLEVVESPMPVDPYLAGMLDAGEASAIALARSMPGAAVLMDEQRGRRIATSRKFSPRWRGSERTATTCRTAL
jgi:predicted nucleic acid-binding protein